MRFKNYYSAIHNFAHSFQSINYAKSGRLAFNVLVLLNNSGVDPLVTFDFMLKTIEPTCAVSNESRQLLNDYLEWLPEHFKNHNCDLSGIEILKISISANFEKAFTPYGMHDCKEIRINTKVHWKAVGKDEQFIEIHQDEVINSRFLVTGIQELY